MLREDIERELLRAMRTKDSIRLSVLRMLVAGLKNREIEKRTKTGNAILSQDEVQEVIRTEVKKRIDAREGFLKGLRTDAARREQDEEQILRLLLPPDLSDDEIIALVEDGMGALGASTKKDFGKVMSWVMAKVQGRAEGERVRALLEARLAS